jgi:hypothetical protein
MFCGIRPLGAVDLHRRELSRLMVTCVHNSLKLYVCLVVRRSLSYRKRLDIIGVRFTIVKITARYPSTSLRLWGYNHNDFYSYDPRPVTNYFPAV